MHSSPIYLKTYSFFFLLGTSSIPTQQEVGTLALLDSVCVLRGCAHQPVHFPLLYRPLLCEATSLCSQDSWPAGPVDTGTPSYFTAPGHLSNPYFHVRNIITDSYGESFLPKNKMRPSKTDA